MNTSRKVWICTVLLSFPMLAGQGIIQPFPAQAAPDAESLIRLHVVVNDKSGKPVSGLEQKDFTVVDNKFASSRAATSFGGGGLPSRPMLD
jgi:hypothetical protein